MTGNTSQSYTAALGCSCQSGKSLELFSHLLWIVSSSSPSNQSSYSAVFYFFNFQYLLCNTLINAPLRSDSEVRFFSQFVTSIYPGLFYWISKALLNSKSIRCLIFHSKKKRAERNDFFYEDFCEYVILWSDCDILSFTS